MESIKYHPVCKLFPAMSADEQDALTADIEANGLREPIVMYRGLLIDGRHRLTACQLAHVEPRFVEWDGKGSLVAFVASKNQHRRHLTESQRAVCGLRIREELEREAAQPDETPAPKVVERSEKTEETGQNELNDGPSEKSPLMRKRGRPKRKNEEAAALAGTTERAIERAAAVEKAAPELLDAVESGELSLHAAEQRLAPPPDPIAETRKTALQALTAFDRAAYAHSEAGGPVDLAAIQRGTKLCRDAFDSAPKPETPPVLEFPCNGSAKTWGLSTEQLDEWQGLYPGVDVMGECRKALAWIKSNQRKTAKGMPKFLVGWLNRANDRGVGNGQKPHQQRQDDSAARMERNRRIMAGEDVL